MVDAATTSLRREYERREASAAVSGKVAASKAVAAARLTVLRAQDGALAAAVSAAGARAAGLAGEDPAAYEALLVDLAAQAVHALAGQAAAGGGGGGGGGGTASKSGAPPLRLRVRAQDLAAGRAALAALPARYAALYGGAVAPPVSLDESDPLPPGPPAGGDAAGADTTTAAARGRFCAGGVVASSADGRISVPNTLDARLAIACEQTLPAVRAALFDV
jgi:vacuolar-type H+-ATPase subunit E/Vma4